MINGIFQDSLVANKRMKIIVLSPDAKSITRKNACYMGNRVVPINRPFGDPNSTKELEQELKLARKNKKHN